MMEWVVGEEGGGEGRAGGGKHRGWSGGGM